MPVASVALADHRLQTLHSTSPNVRLEAGGAAWAEVPAALRAAADQVWLKRGAAGPEAAWFQWRAGERWLQGEAAEVRGLFRQSGRRVFVPLHRAAGEDLDLIWLEPRAWTGGAGRGADVIDLRIRIGAAEGDGGKGQVDEPWAELARATRARDLGGLADFARRLDLHAALHGLALRNLAVELLRRQVLDEAELLLRQASGLHPAYRELDYLAARVYLAQGRVQETVGALQRATRPPEADAPSYYVGSGGEAGYRSHALLALLAEGTGSQAAALHHFMSGVRARPAHAASVAGVLRQRVPKAMLAPLAGELSALGRREPEHRGAIFDFLLLHRAFAEAERLLRVWPLAEEEQQLYRRRLGAHAALRGPGPRRARGRRGVMIEGPMLIHASTAAINRRLAGGLAEAFEVGLEPTVAGEVAPAEVDEPAGWSAGLRQLPRQLDLTVRHGWPPNFAPPATGRLAVVLPWEFGAVPKAWVEAAAAVDEFWVPSAFVRGVLARAGIDAGRIAVVPNGVDLDRFAPRGGGERPAGARRFEFLYVGGAIRRKGLDVLLRAWREAFRADDDVCLVIKSVGGRSYYRHLALDAEIAEVARDPSAAPVIHLEEDWREERMAALYRGCDALALPYRGEGFGMPLAEAMACGKPVIATGRGPAPEFCPPDAGWLLEAREVEVPAAERPAGAMSGPFTWFEPSQAALVEALRAAARDAEGCAERGRAAARAIRATHGWDRILETYRERAARLAEGA